MTISNLTLVKIGAIGGVATVTMGLLYKNKLNYNIKQSEFYKDALNTLRTHKGAVQLLGEPIRDINIDVSDTGTNFTKENTAQYKVPLKGSKQRGYLYLWAEKNEMKHWDLVRMELEIANEPNKRFLFKTTISDKNSS